MDRLEEQFASRLGERDLQEYVKQCTSGDDMNISALEEKRESIRSARELRSSQAGELEQQVSKDEGILETKMPNRPRNGERSSVTETPRAAADTDRPFLWTTRLLPRSHQGRYLTDA